MRIVPTCTQVFQFGDDGMVHCPSSPVSTWTSDVLDHVHCDCCESLLPVGGSGDEGARTVLLFFVAVGSCTVSNWCVVIYTITHRLYCFSCHIFRITVHMFLPHCVMSFMFRCGNHLFFPICSHNGAMCHGMVGLFLRVAPFVVRIP